MAEDSKYDTLTDAMAAGDALAEALLRYRGLAETWGAMPQLRGQINSQLSAMKSEIERLRALKAQVAQPDAPADSDEAKFGKVVPIDGRFSQAG
ncbi:MAG TPA: hypothetical protein VJL80_06520 [Aeromicrobium sp.]|nr:hypothetical protein [Aeromicrobium sp.]HKY57673.1 hypothetical protein [Aeromicrobium sp.]